MSLCTLKISARELHMFWNYAHNRMRHAEQNLGVAVYVEEQRKGIAQCALLHTG